MEIKHLRIIGLQHEVLSSDTISMLLLLLLLLTRSRKKTNRSQRN